MLWFDENEDMIMCHSLTCGFMIGSQKMNMICAQITIGKLKDFEELDLVSGDEA